MTDKIKDGGPACKHEETAHIMADGVCNLYCIRCGKKVMLSESERGKQ